MARSASRTSLGQAPVGLETGGLGDTKSLPCSAGQVNIVRAITARAHVHDGGLARLALVLNVDLSTAPWVAGGTSHDIVRGTTLGVPCTLGNGDNHHVVGEGLTAGTSGTVVVIDGDVDILVNIAARG